MKDILNIFNEYIKSLAETTMQEKTEHTDRGHLKKLLTELANLGKFNAQAINEQSRQGKNNNSKLYHLHIFTKRELRLISSFWSLKCELSGAIDVRKSHCWWGCLQYSKKAWNICGTLAEERGFEPLIVFAIHAFQACALNHSATLPLR